MVKETKKTFKQKLKKTTKHQHDDYLIPNQKPFVGHGTAGVMPSGTFFSWSASTTLSSLQGAIMRQSLGVSPVGWCEPPGISTILWKTVGLNQAFVPLGRWLKQSRCLSFFFFVCRFWMVCSFCSSFVNYEKKLSKETSCRSQLVSMTTR